MSNQIDWQRAFIRSGFVSREENGKFHFDQENYKAEKFLVSIFRELNLLDDYKNKVFSPSSATVNESDWLASSEKSNTSVGEVGIVAFSELDLGSVDTYMAGIVRWLNFAGIETSGSCDGHSGVRRPHLNFADQKKEPLFDYFLAIISNDNWHFRNREFRKNGETQIGRAHV